MLDKNRASRLQCIILKIVGFLVCLNSWKPKYFFQYLHYLLQIFDLVWHHVIIKGNIYARQEQGKSTPVVGHK